MGKLMVETASIFWVDLGFSAQPKEGFTAGFPGDD